MQINHEELERWPQKPAAPRRPGTTFRADHNTLVADLQRELEYLGAVRITLESALPPRCLRRDGWPRPDAPQSAAHPGIVLRFERKGREAEGEQVYACDTYTQWRANLRAISLTLTALRAMERYGASEGRQYHGFAPKLAARNGQGKQATVAAVAGVKAEGTG